MAEVAYTPEQQARYDEMHERLDGMGFPEAMVDQQARWAANGSEPPKLRTATAREARGATYLDEQRRVRGTPLEYINAADLDPNLDGILDELIERTLARGALSVVYGDSNAGKTFLALDIGYTVARELPIWRGGRRVHGGIVVYLASESPSSPHLRTEAYRRHHALPAADLCSLIIVTSPIDLFSDTADTDALIDLINDELRAAEGAPPVELIIGDTLARMSPGANENGGDDMGIVFRNIDRIREKTGAHFMLIHHTGKDAAKGMRGWSGMRAAIDTEIEVTADDLTGNRVAEITKQRDLPGKGDRIGFRLETVSLGKGKWGQPITSCVVVDADAPAKGERNKRPSEIAGAITELLTSRGAGMRKGELVQHFDGRYHRAAVYREIKKMIEAHKLRDVVGILGLVQP